MTALGFSIEVDATTGAPAVLVRGELDMSAAPSLLDALASAAPSDATLMVDLGEVTFIDSTAIGALVEAGQARAAAGGRLQLGPRSAVVARVLELVGLAETTEAFDVLPERA